MSAGVFQISDGSNGATTPGAYAEFKCMPEDGALLPMPDNISYAEAAAIVEGGLTALNFQRNKANIQPGQQVLIYGASGSVGTAAVQVAKHFGANVTAVCSTANFDLVKSIGGIMIAVPLLMVPLTQFLNFRANRLANLFIGVLQFVVIIGVNMAPDLDDIFFAVIELTALVLIVGLAWKWKVPAA